MKLAEIDKINAATEKARIDVDAMKQAKIDKINAATQKACIEAEKACINIKNTRNDRES